MSLEEIPSIIYAIVFAPLSFLLHKHVNHSNRITKLETEKINNQQKLDRLCKSNELLIKEFYELKGTIEQHLNQSNFKDRH